MLQISKRNRKVGINRPYKCSAVMHWSAKFWVLELYFDFLEKSIEKIT